MIPHPYLDAPDDALGAQDPFVSAVRVWTSLEGLRRLGWPPDYIKEAAQSMDAVLVRHRRVLVEQFMAADSDRYPDLPALLRHFGLEYWEDGQVLAANDPKGGRARRGRPEAR